MLLLWHSGELNLNQSQRVMLATMLSTQNNTKCVLEDYKLKIYRIARVYGMLLRERWLIVCRAVVRLSSRCNRFTSTNNMISNYMFALAIFMFTSSFFSSSTFRFVTCSFVMYVLWINHRQLCTQATHIFKMMCNSLLAIAVEKKKKLLTWLRWYHARFLLAELHV